MSKEYKLEVEKRTKANKKDLKELRKSGKIPGMSEVGCQENPGALVEDPLKQNSDGLLGYYC